jgi:adenosyl cobinamide kinase/adenosyl cobinamide phosphate guanylyltransferase
MKKSVRTGEQIYKELKELYKDIKELGEATDMVGDEIGAGSVAHKHLSQLYDQRKKELNKLLVAEYVVTAEAPAPAFGPGEGF